MNLKMPSVLPILLLFAYPVAANAETPYVDPSTGMEFAFVKGGCFDMGDSAGDGDPNERPVHQACVADFYLGKYEVTNEQFKKFKPQHNSGTSEGASLGDDKQPVVNVSWDDAVAYAGWLSKQSGQTYRLPTEAEWEYAARSKGREEKYAGGDQVEFLAWFNENSDGKTHSVGEKRPNGCGLFDMCGNVWEWCQDIFDDKAYTRHFGRNPVITDEDTNRVIRGGSWNLDAWSARCARRLAFQQELFGPALGFRLVREAGF